jgi:hypothetical protein
MNPSVCHGSTFGSREAHPNPSNSTDSLAHSHAYRFFTGPTRRGTAVLYSILGQVYSGCTPRNASAFNLYNKEYGIILIIPSAVVRRSPCSFCCSAAHFCSLRTGFRRPRPCRAMHHAPCAALLVISTNTHVRLMSRQDLGLRWY